MLSAHRRISVASLLLLGVSAFGQNTPAAPNPAKNDKAAAYYNYALGHLYAELAAAYGNRGEYFNKAVDSYRAALKADPAATFIAEELSDLYIQSGRLREAVMEAEEALKQNASDMNARRLLARIYTRMIGDTANKVDENMVKKAIEQYEKITEGEPKDTDSWLMLGRLQKIAQNSTDALKAYKKALELDSDNEDAMTGLAMVYTDLGDNKAAAELMRKVADKNPNPRSLTNLAGIYEQLKDYSLAAEMLRRALLQQPGNTDLKRALAEDLLRSEQLDDATKTYQELIQEDAKDEQSLLRLSQIYRQKRDFAKARQAADKAKELDPTNLEIQFNEVLLLQAEGRAPDAIKILKGILDSTAKKSYSASERSNRAQLMNELGYLHRSVEQYNEAIEVFRQVEELDPDSGSRAAAEIIETYRVSKDFAKAEAVVEAASKKYANDRTIASERARVMADLGKTDQAVAETRKLMDGKNDRQSYLSLAEIYEKAKNWDEMAKMLDQAENLSGNEGKEDILFMRGAMYERMKNYTAAEAEFRKVLAINPDNAATLNYLGYMLADRNTRLDEAKEMIMKALEREPNSGAYLDSLGWVYFRLNKLPEAEEKLRRALQFMSRDATVHDHLGDVYLREGKIREAIAQWQSSLKEWQTSSPSDQDHAEVAKIQKKLDDAKFRLAKETGAAKQL
jgi:tetratricopeptide (TPR) repeat protein